MMDSTEEYFNTIKQSSDPFEKALLIHILHHEREISVKKISRQLDVSSSYISNYLRLLKIPELVRDGFYSKSVSVTHLIILSRLLNSEDMIKGFEEILQHNLSCPQTEEYVRQRLHGISSEGNYPEKALYERIKQAIHKIDPGVSVKIIQTRIRLKVIIQSKGKVTETNELLEKLLSVLSVDKNNP